MIKRMVLVIVASTFLLILILSIPVYFLFGKNLIKRRLSNQINNQPETMTVSPTPTNFQFAPYDKVFGTTGPKAILYVSIANGALFNDLQTSTFPYLKWASNQGAIQFAVRNRDSWSIDNFKTSDELDRATANVALDGYTNCVKLLYPDEYFTYISTLDNVYLHQDITYNDAKGFVNSLDVYLPQNIDHTKIKKCIENGDYKSIIASEQTLEGNVFGTPALIFPDIMGKSVGDNIWNGIVTSNQNALDVITKIVNINNPNYKPVTGEEKLKQILQ